MATTTEKKRKHLILSQKKLTLAKKILGTKTETETVEVALDSIITEAERDKLAWEATEKFLKGGIKSGGKILDVYGNLDD